MNPARLKAYIYLLIATLIWAFAGVVIKVTLKELTPGVFLTYRFFISTLIMLPILFIKKKHMPRKNLRTLLLASIFGTTINIGLLFYGTRLTTVNELAVITAVGPILAIIASAIFLHEHITKREKTGTLITLLGTAILIGEPFFVTHGDGFTNVTGNLILMASNIGWVGYLIFSKELLRQKIDPILITASGFIVGLITLFPFAISETGSFPNLINIIIRSSINTHLEVLYMAIFSGVIAYVLYQTGAKTIEVSEAAIFTYLQAVFTVPFAVTLLGEQITIPFLVGSVIVIIGVIIAEWKKKRYRQSL